MNQNRISALPIWLQNYTKIAVAAAATEVTHVAITLSVLTLLLVTWFSKVSLPVFFGLLVLFALFGVFGLLVLLGAGILEGLFELLTLLRVRCISLVASNLMRCRRVKAFVTVRDAKHDCWNPMITIVHKIRKRLIRENIVFFSCNL